MPNCEACGEVARLECATCNKVHWCQSKCHLQTQHRHSTVGVRIRTQGLKKTSISRQERGVKIQHFTSSLFEGLQDMIVRVSLEDSTIYAITGEFIGEDDILAHIDSIAAILRTRKLGSNVAELLRIMDSIFIRDNKPGRKPALDSDDATALSIYISLTKNLVDQVVPDLSYYPENYRSVRRKHWGAKEFVKSLIDSDYMEKFYRLLATPVPMDREGYILTGIFNNLVTVDRVEIADKAIAGGRLVRLREDLPPDIALEVVYRVRMDKLFWLTMRTLILRMRMCGFNDIDTLLWWSRVDFSWSLIENTLAGDLYTLRVERSVLILSRDIWQQLYDQWNALTSGDSSFSFGDNPANFNGYTEVRAAYANLETIEDALQGNPVVNDYEPEDFPI